VFQPFYAAADCRLGQMKLFGGTANGAMLMNGQKNLDFSRMECRVVFLGRAGTSRCSPYMSIFFIYVLNTLCGLQSKNVPWQKGSLLLIATKSVFLALYFAIETVCNPLSGTG